ncbi:DISARM system phospholipase D-like protein DrmC [Spirillospora sp. NPDC052242]
MTGDLPSIIAATAAELAPGHLAAWCRVLRTTERPSASVEAALLEARPGYALGGIARRLVSAWRHSGATGESVALALETAGVIRREQSAHRSTVVASGPLSDAVPVRLTSQVALEVVREATTSLLIVSFAAHGVAEIVTELAWAAERGVRVDLVLETSMADGGTLDGPGAAAAFRTLRGRDGVRFWHWPRERRPVLGRSRASLHAKLIAADERSALLGSANLTDRALAENLEIGVVLREPSAVRSLVRHFRALMRPVTGPLVPLP